MFLLFLLFMIAKLSKLVSNLKVFTINILLILSERFYDANITFISCPSVGILISGIGLRISGNFR